MIETTGNGRLDAVSNAIKMYFGISYELTVYEEHAISRGSSSKAAAYVGITCKGKEYWGVGIDEDIIKSSVAALVSAGNKLAENENLREGREERIVDIIKYINAVSYTHLDVYKRQDLHGKPGKPYPGRTIQPDHQKHTRTDNTGTGHRPLDVYKRQHRILRQHLLLLQEALRY